MNYAPELILAVRVEAENDGVSLSVDEAIRQLDHARLVAQVAPYGFEVWTMRRAHLLDNNQPSAMPDTLWDIIDSIRRRPAQSTEETAKDQAP